jgi:D-sedoheptulose 7-phosphate isomerase
MAVKSVNGVEKYVKSYLNATATVIDKLSRDDMEKMVQALISLKKRQGRLFMLGVGGSAANCSHAVNDFRKICNIETYTPVDNVSELTARTNDIGWDTVFADWLKGSRLTRNDAVMVFSVGGGNLEKNVSPNIVRALEYTKEIEATILGIVGRDGGYTKKVADVCILIPTISAEMITPLSESFQAVVWHGLVTAPGLS